MHIYLVLAEIGFLLWIFRNISFWVMLWQLKEYRWDRLWTHLKETYQGQRLLFSPLNVCKWFTLFLYVLVVFSDRLDFLFILASGLIFIGEGVKVLFELFRFRIRRPVRTAKAIAIFFLSFSALLFLFLVPLTDLFLWMLILDRVLPIFVALFVVFFALPTEVYHDYLSHKAILRLQQFPNLLVIAVSGSYGKSSTKECIAQILSQKFNVVKTKGSNNTPAGIIATVLKDINEETDIFVVEMGSYRKGEVAQLCKIVRPRISITTSVSDQHLSLFGNLKNVMDTEMELVQMLPRGGISLFNANDKGSLKMYEKSLKVDVRNLNHRTEDKGFLKHILYGVHYGKQAEMKELAISADDIRVQENGVVCSVVLGKRKIVLRIPLLGQHMVENVLPALFVASYLGMSLESIKRGVSTLVSPPKTMRRIFQQSGVILIDDSFNASPESVLAILEYMKVYTKKKVLVLMPLIELNKHGSERHYQIGLAASKICDYLFLTNRNFYEDIARGVSDGKGGCMVLVGSSALIAGEIPVLTSKGDVVVFEGKEAGKTMLKLKYAQGRF